LLSYCIRTKSRSGATDRPVPDLDCKDVELAELGNKENIFAELTVFQDSLRSKVIILNLL